jgi:hypothetical protein
MADDHRADERDDRRWDRRDDERGLLDRIADEIRAWFGEHEIGHRRRQRDRAPGGGPEDVDREWARRWGHVESRDQRGGPRGWGWTTQERHHRPAWPSGHVLVVEGEVTLRGTVR